MSITVLPNEKPTRTLSEFEYLHSPDSKEARLGKGSFASVKLVKEKASGTLLALKTVDVSLKEASKSDMHNLRMEIQVHRELDHPNIIKFHDYLIEEGRVYMLLDYAPKGNLYTYMHKTKTLPLDKVFKFFYQTCLSVAYLHGKDILHRDIKPENLLLDKDLNIKLCDFGWAARSIKDKRTTFCGTYEYMAPELVAKSTYNYKVDIWSLGILLYELFHSEAPYKGRSLSDIQVSMARETIHYNPVIQPELKDLIARILQKDPEQRPELPEILNHPWVRSNLVKSELSQINPSIGDLSQPDQQQPSQSQNQISSQNSLQSQELRAQTAPSVKDQRHRAVSTPHNNVDASTSVVKKTPFAALHRQMSDNREVVKEKEVREAKETSNSGYITAGQKLQVAYSTKEFSKPVPLGYTNPLAERSLSGLGLSAAHKNYSDGHSVSLQSESASKLTKGLSLQLGKALKNGTRNMENEYSLTPEKEQTRTQESVSAQINRTFLRSKLSSERSLTKENTHGHNPSVSSFGNSQPGFTSTRHAYTTTNNMYGATNTESFSQALGYSHEYKSASKINNTSFTKDYTTKEPLSASSKLPSRSEYSDIQLGNSKSGFGSRIKREGGVKLDVQRFYPFGTNSSGSVASPQHSFEASSAGLSTSKSSWANKSSINTSASHYTFARADSDTRLNYPNSSSFGSFAGSYNYGQNSYKGTSSPIVDKHVGKDVREGGYKVNRSNTYMDMRSQGKGSFLA